MPEYPGGLKAMYQYIQIGFHYPEELRKDSVSGTTIFTFVVSPTGKTLVIDKLKGLHPLIDGQIIQLLNNMPRWQPGEKDGHLVPVKFTVPVKIGPPQPALKAEEVYEEKVYIATERPPVFPGGNEALLKFIRKNFKASSEYKTKGIEGAIVIATILGIDGTIRKKDTQLLKGLGYGTDESMLEVVNNLPAFTPSYQNNVPVLHKITLVIRLDEYGKVTSVLPPVQGRPN
ncbi:energy transducer TonB [Rufibacter hautae]|nr:energy transducer TonB [Rufibacter hautae]